MSVDEIVQDASMQKPALYRKFGSKDQLVVEVLNQRIVSIGQNLDALMEGEPDPLNRLKKIFDWHGDWFREAAFAGCLFMRATADYNRQKPDISALVTQQKCRLASIIATLLGEMAFNADTRTRLARRIVHAIDGAIVEAHTAGAVDAADLAWETTLDMIALARTRHDRVS